ncbi:MAG: hypothetical protein ACE1Z2_07840 [Acidobacteriota bacterium]
MMSFMLRKFLIVMMIMGFSGVSLWSQGSRQWRQVGMLTNDVSEGQTLLDVKWIIPGKAARLILLESPDGALAEVRKIENIYGNNVILNQRLENDFAKGSRLYQQSTTEETD